LLSLSRHVGSPTKCLLNFLSRGIIVAKRLVIGICGVTGSGKTTITERIISLLSPESVLVLQQDHYYKNFPHLSVEQRARQNFDHPDSFDTPFLIEHVRQLREGCSIDRPIYDFTKHERASSTAHMSPSPAMILEGILIFENEALCELMDIKIFVDTVRPMHLEFIEPSQRHADVIIPEGGHNEVGIDLVIQKIRSLVLADEGRVR
jgi:uridine kinase